MRIEGAAREAEPGLLLCPSPEFFPQMENEPGWGWGEAERVSRKSVAGDFIPILLGLRQPGKSGVSSLAAPRGEVDAG